MSRTSSTLRTRNALLVALAVLAPAACGDDDPTPTGLDLELVVGTYDLATLRFDPQGSLPDTNVLPTLGQDNVQLILTASRTAQVVYQDPISNLFTTIPGTYRTTETGIRLEFASNAPYGGLLLSRRMDFELVGGATLSFAAAAPDGVDRDRLLELVPAFEGEQLLDPTPGQLTVTFTRAP